MPTKFAEILKDKAFMLMKNILYLSAEGDNIDLCICLIGT